MTSTTSLCLHLSYVHHAWVTTTVYKHIARSRYNYTTSTFQYRTVLVPTYHIKSVTYLYYDINLIPYFIYYYIYLESRRLRSEKVAVFLPFLNIEI